MVSFWNIYHLCEILFILSYISTLTYCNNTPYQNCSLNPNYTDTNLSGLCHVNILNCTQNTFCTSTTYCPNNTICNTLCNNNNNDNPCDSISSLFHISNNNIYSIYCNIDNSNKKIKECKYNTTIISSITTANPTSQLTSQSDNNDDDDGDVVIILNSQTIFIIGMIIFVCVLCCIIILITNRFNKSANKLTSSEGNQIKCATKQSDSEYHTDSDHPYAMNITEDEDDEEYIGHGDGIDDNSSLSDTKLRKKIQIINPVSRSHMHYKNKNKNKKHIYYNNRTNTHGRGRGRGGYRYHQQQQQQQQQQHVHVQGNNTIEYNGNHNSAIEHNMHIMNNNHIRVHPHPQAHLRPHIVNDHKYDNLDPNDDDGSGSGSLNSTHLHLIKPHIINDDESYMHSLTRAQQQQYDLHINQSKEEEHDDDDDVINYSNIDQNTFVIHKPHNNTINDDDDDDIDDIKSDVPQLNTPRTRNYDNDTMNPGTPINSQLVSPRLIDSITSMDNQNSNNNLKPIIIDNNDNQIHNQISMSTLGNTKSKSKTKSKTISKSKTKRKSMQTAIVHSSQSMDRSHDHVHTTNSVTQTQTTDNMNHNMNINMNPNSISAHPSILSKKLKELQKLQKIQLKNDKNIKYKSQILNTHLSRDYSLKTMTNLTNLSLNTSAYGSPSSSNIDPKHKYNVSRDPSDLHDYFQMVANKTINKSSNHALDINTTQLQVQQQQSPSAMTTMTTVTQQTTSSATDTFYYKDNQQHKIEHHLIMPALDEKDSSIDTLTTNTNDTTTGTNTNESFAILTPQVQMQINNANNIQNINNNSNHIQQMRQRLESKGNSLNSLNSLHNINYVNNTKIQHINIKQLGINITLSNNSSTAPYRSSDEDVILDDESFSSSSSST